MPEPSDQCTGKHDPGGCNLCGVLRHPAQAAQGRALAAHLREHPMPKQAGAR